MPGPSPDVVRSILNSRNITQVSCARIAEGGDHVTFAVNGDLIIRFATEPHLSANHRREHAVREHLRCSTRIPIAEIITIGEWAPGLSYMLEKRIEGTSLECAQLSTRGVTLLAHVIDELHAIDAGFDLEIIPDADPDRMINRALAAVDGMPELGLGRDDVLEQPFPVNIHGHRLLHADFKGEHILADGEGGLTGIIDWTDVAYGDVAWDIGGLAISVGAHAARHIGACANTPLDAIDRGISIARLHTLHALWERRQFRRQSPLTLLYRQCERAWDQRFSTTTND